MPKNSDLSSESEDLFASLRQTLNGETEEITVVAEGETEAISVDDSAANWREAETVVQDSVASETVTESIVLPADATMPIDSPAPAASAASAASADSERKEAPAANPTNPAGPGFGPEAAFTPAAAGTTYGEGQNWVVQNDEKSPVRVGLLVWSGILVIMGLLVGTHLFIPQIDGAALTVILLGLFGIILIVGAFTSNARSGKLQRQGNVGNNSSN